MSDYLCEELIFDIFTRLPPKSLLRFRSLSKSLRSLISSPSFIRMHTLRSPQKLLIRHQKYDLKEDFCTLHSEDQLPMCPRRGYFGITPVKFPVKFPNVDIVGSCNGILCLYDMQHIILWNPLIRRKLTLPNCPQICISGRHFGFGFDPISDDYKIVNVYDPRYGRNAESSFLYTMKTGSWCEIACPTPFNWNHVNSKACFVNGALHWLVRRDFANPGDVDHFYILTFHLSSHVFGMIALPESSWKTKLTIIQGSLAVISMGDGDTCIWVRRDASWSVFSESRRIQVEGMILKVLQPCSNGDLLFQTQYEGFQVYNRKLGYVQSRLADLNSGSICMVDMEMISESLGLLDMGTSCKGN